MFHNLLHTKNFIHKKLLILGVYFIVLIITMDSFKVLSPLVPGYYMSFLLGALFCSTYIFFSEKTNVKGVIVVLLNLLLLLTYSADSFIHTNVSILLCMLYCIFVLQLNLSIWFRFSLFTLGIFFTIYSLWEEKAFIFLLGSLFLIGVTFAKKSLNNHRFDVFIVFLLCLLSVLGTLWPGKTPDVFIIKKNIILTIPLSFFLYIIIFHWKSICANLFKLLDSKSFFFLGFQGIVFLYGLNICLYKNEIHISRLILLAALISMIVCFYDCFMKMQLEKNLAIIEKTFNSWFLEKWELAITSQAREFSWSGFETLLKHLFSNDGILILYKDEIVYKTGYLKNLSNEADIVTLDGLGNLSIKVHETLNHQSFPIHSYYMLFALAEYLNEKMTQWEMLCQLHLTIDSENYSKGLQFRKDVTYFLHDNILQNIIATKNIISTFKTEKSALKNLAVETLTDLNDSIRSQMHEIYPSTLLDLSFERNIHILVNELKNKFGIIPFIHIKCQIYEQLDEEYGYYLYRSIQELLNNSCKHAEAENIWIDMHIKDSIILEIANDGLELPSDIGENKVKHLGLSSMIHQAAKFKGNFEIIQEGDRKSFRIILPRRDYEDTTV
jgi:Signal transduction histidine kinase, glucose-6-phosphate specific